MSTTARLSTGTYENFRTVTVTDALRALAPDGVTVPRVGSTHARPLPDGVSPVLAAIAEGSCDVAWERHVLDPDELLGSLPSLFGTACDLDGEVARLEAVADHFLCDSLPHLLRVASMIGAGTGVVALAEILPLGREDLVGTAHDLAFTRARNAIVPVYASTPSDNGKNPNPAWRCLGAMEALENGTRHLRDMHGPVWRGEPRPGEDPRDPWVERRLREYREDGDRVRLRDVTQAARSFARGVTLVTVARRLVGEDAAFEAPALLERLASPATAPAGPGPR